MPTLELTVGLPASGKSTYARELVSRARPGTLARVNRDDIRVNVFGGRVFGRDVEDKVSIVQHAAVSELLRAGVSVIVDDTNLISRHRLALAEIADKHGAAVQLTPFLNVPLSVCLERNRARPESEFVPEDAIRRMHEKWIKSGQWRG